MKCIQHISNIGFLTLGFILIYFTKIQNAIQHDCNQKKIVNADTYFTEISTTFILHCFYFDFTFIYILYLHPKSYFNAKHFSVLQISGFQIGHIHIYFTKLSLQFNIIIVAYIIVIVIHISSNFTLCLSFSVFVDNILNVYISKCKK